MVALAVMTSGVLVAAAATLTAPAAATTVSGPTIRASRSSGAVGDTVNLSGNVGSGCTSTVVWVTFAGPQIVPGEPAGNLTVRVPVRASGTWSVHAYEIPSFLEGGATFSNAPVEPGTYTFSLVTCGRSAAVPFQVTGTFAAQPSSRFVGMARTYDGKGYWLAQKDGGVFSFGDARFYGALPAGPGGLGITPAAPITGIAATPNGGGYWLVGADGGVFSFGDARFYGSLPGEGIHPRGQIVGITPTPDGKGYWLLGADGGVFSFGDARFYGGAGYDLATSALVSTPGWDGYLRLKLTGSTISAGASAALLPRFPTSPPATFTHWFTSMAATPDGQGLWRASTDGGVFTLGDAPYLGSVPGLGITPAAPIVGIAATPDGGGYWLVGADGGVFSFGDAHFFGAAGGSGLPW